MQEAILEEQTNPIMFGMRQLQDLILIDPIRTGLGLLMEASWELPESV